MHYDPREIALGLGLALAVGALVGIERERHARVENKPTFGGVRTFPLIGLCGGLASMLTAAWGVWAVAGPFLAISLLLAVSYWWAHQRGERAAAGLTSEIAALLVYGIGALPFTEIEGLDWEARLILTIALGAVVMTLLSLREPLHRLTEKVSREDVYATVRFALMAAVVLPILPDRTFGVLGIEVLNPFWIGVVVVLIAGISFTGYVSVRVLGARKGIGLTALLGGLVSSTAVTLTFSGRGKKNPALALACAFAIILASTAMFPRILIETSVIEQSLTAPLVPPLAVMLGVGLVGCLVVWRRAGQARKEKPEDEGPRFQNPFSLKEALKLGAAFAVIRFAAEAAHIYWGSGGLYLSAALAGLTDVDAITISVARMYGKSLRGEGGIGQDVAVTAVTLAVISNTLTKAGMALVLGGRRVGVAVASVLVAASAAGIVAALLL